MRITALFIALVLVASNASAQRMIIRAGRLLDVRTGQVASDVTVIVNDGRIVAVGPASAPGAGDTVVDLSRYTVLPGLIDAHVHRARERCGGR